MNVCFEIKPRFVRVGLVVLLALASTACQKSATVKEDEVLKGNAANQPSGAKVYIDLAAAYLREGRLEQALQNARKALAADNKNPLVYNVLALIYQRLGELGAAEENFAKAESLNSEDPYIANAHGTFLCSQGRFDEANERFRKAADNAFYPTPWVALTNAGNCAEQDGNLVASERYLRRALTANPKFSPALLRMAKLTYKKQNFLSSRAYLARLHQLVSPTPESLWLGIRVERQLGDAQIRTQYEQMLKTQFPDSEQVQYLQGAS